MFWGADDFARARMRLAEVEQHRQQSERQRLDALAGLVETAACRRAVLLRHFGEEPAPTCGNCDNCLEAPGVADATQLAQKLLSAVYRPGQRSEARRVGEGGVRTCSYGGSRHH